MRCEPSTPDRGGATGQRVVAAGRWVIRVFRTSLHLECTRLRHHTEPVANHAEGIDRRPVVETLTAVLLILVAIAIVYEIARRIGVPYPTLLVLGGLGLAFIPGLPRIELEPDLVLLVFLPPLLFTAAAESPIRDLRANVVPLVRLSIGLVLFTMVLVAVVAHALVPGLSWAAAFTLGAIVGPTDALAATAVFRRLGTPRIIRTLIEGEALFNDATALVAYRAAVIAARQRHVHPLGIAGRVRGRGGRRDRSSAPSSVVSRARSCVASTTHRSRS